VVIHGTEATGRSSIIKTALTLLSNQSGAGNDGNPLTAFTVVDCPECITNRHLLETAVRRAADALSWHGPSPKCESVSQLTVEFSKMLLYADRPPRFCFTLVLDAIDQQRENASGILPALARLPEIVRDIAS
jgi:origin recognition complex subunit 5